MASTPKKISQKKLQEGIDSGVIIPAGTSGKYYKHSKNPDLTFSADDADYFDDFDWNSSDFDIRKSFNQNDLAKVEANKKVEAEAEANKKAEKEKAKAEKKAKDKAEIEANKNKPAKSDPVKEILGAMSRNQFGMGGAAMSNLAPSIEQVQEDQKTIEEVANETNLPANPYMIKNMPAHAEDVPQALHDMGVAVTDETKEKYADIYADTKEAEEKVKNGETSEVIKDPETPKEIKKPARSIWDAWLNGEFGDKDSDSAKKERDYLILDAIGTFAKNTGRQLGNVGAQYTGGSIDNNEDMSAWEQKQQLRNRAEFANQAQKNAEADYDSPAGRQKASEILNLEMQQYMTNKAATVQDLMDDWNAKANDPNRDPVTAMYYRDLVTKLAASGVSPMSTALQGIQGVSSIVGTVLGAAM